MEDINDPDSLVAQSTNHGRRSRRGGRDNFGDGGTVPVQTCSAMRFLEGDPTATA